MKTRTVVITLVALVLAAVGARAVMQKRQNTAAAAATTAKAAPLELELAPADVIRVASVDLARTIEVSGGLKAAEAAVVKARVAGELKTLTVREGDAVRTGQVIGQIETTEFDLRLRQAEQQAQSSRAQLEIAQRALKNNRALVDQGFISSTALETSVQNEAGARANVAAADAAVALARKARGDATLVAPITGLVAQRIAQPGERVGVEARLVEIVNLARLELEAAVPPAAAAELRVGQTAKLDVEGLGAPVTARVARISPTAQPGSRAVLVYLALDADPALRQGLFARGRVTVEERRAVALPASALRNDQMRPTAPAVVNGAVVNRPLDLGTRGQARGEAMVEVRAGVAEGDLVLAGTAGLVRDGTPVKLPREGDGGAKVAQPATSTSVATSTAPSVSKAAAPAASAAAR